MSFIKTAICLFISLWLCSVLHADLLDIYRKGELKLIADDNFGTGTKK
jgi:hypothetical protein